MLQSGVKEFYVYFYKDELEKNISTLIKLNFMDWNFYICFPDSLTMG